MSLEIAWKQNILVTAFHLLKSLLVVFGFGSQAFVCGFSRQNINSALNYSQSIKINIGPSDGEMIVTSTHRPTVLYRRLSHFNIAYGSPPYSFFLPMSNLTLSISLQNGCCDFFFLRTNTQYPLLAPDTQKIKVAILASGH